MVHETWVNVTAARREKGDKSPWWWQEGKQALWSKEKTKQKATDQQRDGLGTFNQGKGSLCRICAYCKVPLMVLECFYLLFLLDSFLFLLLIFLLVLFLLFSVSPCNLWSSLIDSMGRLCWQVLLRFWEGFECLVWSWSKGNFFCCLLW